MLFLAFFFCITLLVYGIFLVRLEKKDKLQKRMAVFIKGEKETVNQPIEKEIKSSFFHRFMRPFWSDFKRSFKKRMPGEKEAKLERKLQLAGNPFGMTPVDFRLVQTALFVILPVLFGGYASLLRAGLGGIILFSFIGILIAVFLPNFYLKQKMKQKSHSALKELPDVLDLLTVSLEAGLGFDSAVNKVVSKKHGVLADEFHRCLEEIRLGKTRREALSGIRDRVEVDEVRSFISSILQAEKLGIGMVQVLRVQSSEVREQRKQRAEEEAMKAPIKMLFPLVLFIFPSLFIVLLGPAIIQFVQTFQK
ncbi:type II secretion system F family protein [Neobacillus sp. D3-1R]|uniref:type II secretion system F family protein n=1 Tax=Neobacillus sp. D3-1R TaxID=3445778 RepID=UPI003FA09299